MSDYPSDYREPPREPLYRRNMDPAALETAARTRNSTQYSQGSVTSWVQSYQQHPPGAPPSESFVSPTRTPRPLPNPQLYTTNPEILDEEEEYMNIDPNVPDMMGGYRNEGLGRGRKPVPAFDPSDPGEPEEEVAVSGGSKSFVGGFVSGLKRFPKVILRYGDKKKPTRKATYGTDITATDGTGNTLPQYASNPPTPMAGPSGVRYMQAIPASMPGSLPQSPPTAPSGHHRQFSMRVTPPSEQAGLEDEAQPYDPDNPPPPQFSDAQRDRPITQVEFDESELAHSVQVFHDVHESITSPPVHTLPSPHPSPHTNQAPLEDQATITQQPGAQTSPSAVLARPLPSDDYRRMSHPTGTLPTTLTTITSTSITSGEPSFSSELNPVHRFFHTLRKMPWVATERVTVDYRPGPGRSGKLGPMNAKVAKKSLVSWYKSQRNRLSGASTADIDLMSSGTVATRSRRTRASATPVASPTTGRVRSRPNLRHHHHHHHTHRHRHNRNRRRDTTSTAVTDNQTPRRGQMSPILPPVYPYPYPYTYGYPTYPAPHSPPRPPHRHQRTTSLTPRGPRSPPRAPSYPMGFAPYQPPPPPPPPPGPVYVLQAPSSGSPRSNEGGQSQTTGQLLSPVYMQMQMVPGSFYQDGHASASNSPPNPTQARPVEPV